MTAPPHETIALAEALGHQVTPEVLFGIGGGTGFGWFTYGDHSTLLTRITTHETAKQSFLLDICDRLRLGARLAGAGSSVALGKKIEAAIKAGESVVVCVGGPAVSYSAVHVTSLTDEVLARAASVPGAARNRFLAIPASAQADVEGAIRLGLAAHVAQMREGFGPPSARGSFGLAGFARWKRSAPSSSPEARLALRAQIEGRGGGPALRLAQAEFLEQAGQARAAKSTRRAADAWNAVAAEPTGAGIDEVEALEREALEAVEAGWTPAS